MRSIDDLIKFVQRLDKTPKSISEILCAIEKFLVPQLEAHETQDVTLLDVRAVTNRFHNPKYSHNTVMNYRARCRFALWEFRRHLKYGDVKLIERPIKKITYLTRLDMMGGNSIRLTPEEAELIRKIIRMYEEEMARQHEKTPPG